ncbi:hypothetical protein TNCV_1271991 [Trichonephila clavipes]|nr:hypothetical protein TNCV_1271991 [Trichonephila clavipes]
MGGKQQVALYVNLQDRKVLFPHFRHEQRAMNRNHKVNAELADTHFIYGLANGNGLIAARGLSDNKGLIFDITGTAEKVEISTGSAHAILCFHAQIDSEKICSKASGRRSERTPPCICTEPTGHYQC